MEQHRQIETVARIVAIVVLAGALLADWPYGYFVFLRWVVTASAILLLTRAFALEKNIWVVVFAVMALLFNPIAPIHLDRETWIVIDVVAAFVFGTSFIIMKNFRHDSE